MKVSLTLALTLPALVLAISTGALKATSTTEARTPAEDELEWLDDLDEARALAAETDRPILLVFR